MEGEILEAKLALANWSKYNDGEEYCEEVYQANKIATALQNLLDKLSKT